MIAFRKAHPTIARSRFWRDDVRWYGAERDVDLSSASHGFAFCLHGRSVSDVKLYVMINAYTQDLRFGIHEGLPGQWRRVVDTSQSPGEDICEPNNEVAVDSPYYTLGPRSVVVLKSLARSP
jgi:glycogen operon protein